jgi:hypothetical protein
VRWIGLVLAVSGCHATSGDCAPTTWYADRDGDGFGSPTDTLDACEQPSGYVAQNTDCNDADPRINPTTMWHLDFDGDGYGHMTVTQGPACTQPSGYVLDGRDCNDMDPMVFPGRPGCPIVTGLSSCRAIVETGKAEGDGAYDVDLDGAGPGPVQTVWCDMTTDGGGWMALLNPDIMPMTMGAGATYSGMAVGGTTNSCTSPPSEIVQHGWRGLAFYSCGDTSARLSIAWPNPVGATDAMFIATAEGQTATFVVGSTTIAATGSTTDGAGATCRFWNGSAATATPGTNQCFTTYLDAAPAVQVGTVGGPFPFTLEITAGPACAPTCSYGAGMNVQKLFVR